MAQIQFDIELTLPEDFNGFVQHVYHRHHMLDPEQEVLSDEFDEVSEYVTAREEDVLVGALRLIPARFKGTPVMDYPDFHVWTGPKVTAEISRLAVNGRDKSQHKQIVTGLYRRMLARSRQLGLEYWIAAMEPIRKQVLQSFTSQWIQIAPPKKYSETVDVTPYVCSIVDTVKILEHTRKELLCGWDS